MSELPRGWVETTFADISEIKLGKMLDQAKNKGQLRPYLRNVNVRWDQIDLDDILEMRFTDEELEPFAIRDGDLLVCEGGEPGRCAAWHHGPTELKFQKALMRLRPRGGIEAALLAKALRLMAQNGDLHHHFTGTTIKHLPQSALAAISVPLPPLAEQKRIVAKLDALNTKSARARTELARIETLVSRYKQAVLTKAFSGELTREWRLNQGLEDWKAVSPETLFKWSSGKNLPSRDYKGGPVPVIGGNGVSGYHDTSNINSSTIVIGRVGALCGNIYHSEGPAWITDNAIYAKWISPAVNLQFSVLVYEVADLNKLSGGTGQPYVNQSILNSIEFPLPDVREQHEIVRCIESAFTKIDRLAVEAKRALKLLGKLDEATLAKAFRGELVPQDENDEPAEHLLARIRAERQAAPKARRGRGAKA